MSVPELWDFQQRSGVFDQISVVWPISADLSGGDRPERIEALATSPNYFTLLGVQPRIGRVYTTGMPSLDSSTASSSATASGAGISAPIPKSSARKFAWITIPTPSSE